MSKISNVDYKFVINRDRYLIYFFNKDTGKWKRDFEDKYYDGIFSKTDEFELIFYRGMLKSYKLKKYKGKTPKYIIIDFYLSKKLSKKKSIIFYKKGDWKVLG